MLQKIEKPDPIDIIEIARQALEQARGDAYKGAQILEKLARKDVAIANELLMPLLSGCSLANLFTACLVTPSIRASSASV